MTWGICQTLKFYLAVSHTTKFTLLTQFFSIQWPRIASSIISSLLQHHCQVVVWSLRPSLKLSMPVTLQLILGFDVKYIRQWPLYKGVGLLHYLHSIISSSKSPQGQIIKADDRGSKIVTCIAWWRLTRCPTTCFYQPVPVSSQTHTHIFQASWVNRTVLNHTITMFWSHLINFISCINHDSLTFIVEVMGWSCGLGDSSCGDKCCYLLRARLNRVCVQKDRGRVGKKEKNWSTRAPKRLLCRNKC